jgi:hypothetical protein
MHNDCMPGLLNMANGGIELSLPPTELDMGVVAQSEQLDNELYDLYEQARGRLSRIVWWMQYP